MGVADLFVLPHRNIGCILFRYLYQGGFIAKDFADQQLEVLHGRKDNLLGLFVVLHSKHLLVLSIVHRLCPFLLVIEVDRWIGQAH